jgi:hypothetical protein
LREWRPSSRQGAAAESCDRAALVATGRGERWSLRTVRAEAVCRRRRSDQCGHIAGRDDPHRRDGRDRGQDDVPAVAKGWRVGDPIPNLTRAGNEPSWTAVRNRYWKNAAARPGAADRYNPENFARMKAGKPPLHHAIPVPKELNHITPRHLGVKHTPKNSQVLWPWDYDDADKFRHYRGPRP